MFEPGSTYPCNPSQPPLVSQGDFLRGIRGGVDPSFGSASRSRIGIPNALFLIWIVTVFLTPLARGQEDNPPIDFSVIRTGELVQTEARVDLPVTQDIAWDVLTDYERYPRFIASMRRSKIVSRSPEGLVVEQQGRFGFLFISQDVNVHLLVSESPKTIVEAHVVDGDLRVMDGRYELTPVGNHVRLSYSGRLVPNFSLPPIFGLSIVRRILFRNFKEIVDEILRRRAEASADSSAG